MDNSSQTLELSALDPSKITDPPSHDVLTFVSGLISQQGPGFFYLRMNEEESKAASEALCSSRDRFFPMDRDEKLKLSNGPEQYFRYGGWRIPSQGPGYRAMGADANFQKDLRESYNMGWDTDGHPNPPYGATPWPDESVAPGFRRACEKYADLLVKRSHWLRKLLAQVLSLEQAAMQKQTATQGGCFSPKDFEENGLHDDTLFDRAAWLLGFVRYQPTHSEVENQKFGIAPHQDDGVFTLLYTDGSPGLQVCPAWSGAGVHRDAGMFDEKLTWFDVPFRENHWIVNLGTMMSRWSGGHFKATLHRVVISETLAARHSVPFFFEPNVDAPIKPVLCARPLEHGLGDAVHDSDDNGADDGDSFRIVTPGGLALEMARKEGVALIRDEPSC